MPKIIKCTATNGQSIEYVDEIIGSGAMKDVYFAPDKSYVVAFYKTLQDAQARERLQMITGPYKDGIFGQAGGDYWRNLFCWPTMMVEHEGRLGMVAPTYTAHFFFEHGSKDGDKLGIKGKEKEGKWFAAANLRQRFIDPRELGDWLTHLKICVLLSRAVRRMHSAGLAHSDLSYKNVLVDPSKGQACVIDVDGLVVPGKYPPDVVGTPDFIAPEVVKTSHLDKTDPSRKLPCRETDLHALAVLIYMYLLYRHPLRGGKVHDIDDEQRDESLSMGEKALFVEHPTDPSNRIKTANAKPTELPWADTQKIPYSITGPYLTALFDRAFISGLHHPAERPSANEWETALVKTVDLVQPCKNPQCAQKWYVFDNSTQPKCPFCGTPFTGKLPILNLYSSKREGNFRPDNHRLMVWTGQSLYGWHANSLVAPNERLTDTQKKRVGYFVLHQDVWWLVNEGLPDLMDVTHKTAIAIGDQVALVDGLQLLLERGDGGRLVVVQMIDRSAAVLA
jgi:serine/threonine protein kinase